MAKTKSSTLSDGEISTLLDSTTFVYKASFVFDEVTLKEGHNDKREMFLLNEQFIVWCTGTRLSDSLYCRCYGMFIDNNMWIIRINGIQFNSNRRV